MTHPGGRPPSEDLTYARTLGLTGVLGLRKVKLRGGAEKLSKLDPDARAVLMQSANYGNSRAVSVGGLRARGMTCHPPKSVMPKDQIEREIQRRLRERGLIKDA